MVITVLLPLVYLLGVILAPVYRGQIGFGFLWLAVLGLIGLSLATGSIWALVYSLSVVSFVNILRAQVEEGQLLKTYGQTYRNYQRRTFF